MKMEGVLGRRWWFKVAHCGFEGGIHNISLCFMFMKNMIEGGGWDDVPKGDSRVFVVVRV